MQVRDLFNNISNINNYIAMPFSIINIDIVSWLEISYYIYCNKSLTSVLNTSIKVYNSTINVRV